MAFAPSADGAGIYFYGRALDSAYATDDVYRLVEARGGPSRMQVRRDRGAPPAGGETFTRTLHVEQDLLPSPHLFHDPDADCSVWDFLFDGFGAKSFAFRTDGASGTGTRRSRSGCRGAATPRRPSTIAPCSGSTASRSARCPGTASRRPSRRSPSTAACCRRREPLEIEALLGPAAPYSLIYLDSFDVAYESVYRAHGNQLECSTGDNAAILISGFTRSDIMVFDVTDPPHPVMVGPEARPASDGSFGVAVSAPARIPGTSP